MKNEKSVVKTRIGLISVVALFVLSPVLAWMFYTGVIGDGYQVSAGKNYGELIHPARPLESIQFVDASDKPVIRENFLGLWTMLLIVDATCDDACMGNVYNMQQIHLALGKDAYRTQYFVLTGDVSDQVGIIDKYQYTPLLGRVPASQSMLSRFPGYTEGGVSAISGRIYLIDPQANLMMQYPHKANPSKILKDLRQLLKATWIRPSA